MGRHAGLGCKHFPWLAQRLRSSAFPRWHFLGLIKTAKLTSWVLVILVLWMPAGCRRELSASLPAHCVTFGDPLKA